MNGDYFKNGKPIHRMSFCAFLDILGFTARMKESYELDKADELLEEFYETFSNQIEVMKKDVDETLLYFKSFSDNILLAYPQFSNDMESEFGFILWSIQDYQLAMALKGFLLEVAYQLEDFLSIKTMYMAKLLLMLMNLKIK